jgi:uncharacterized protein (DUF1697 family)
MTVQIALLRAINVGGQRSVAMADLRALLTELGFEDSRTLLQTGNLVFKSEALAGAALEAMLEAEAEKRLGLRTDFFVRSAEEWASIIASNPFGDAAESDPGHLLVMALKDAPDAEAVAALRAAIVGREIVEAAGKQLYIVYPDGIGRSRLTTALIERKLGTRGTGRNWNTVLKLAALANG